MLFFSFLFLFSCLFFCLLSTKGLLESILNGETINLADGSVGDVARDFSNDRAHEDANNGRGALDARDDERANLRRRVHAMVRVLRVVVLEIKTEFCCYLTIYCNCV